MPRNHLSYSVSNYDYEVIPPNEKGEPLTVVNHADEDAGGDLSEGRFIKIDGRRIFHVGTYRPQDHDQHRAILSCLIGY